MPTTTHTRPTCPIDARAFDPCSDYTGEPYPHASTRRHYCTTACRALGARVHARARRTGQVATRVRVALEVAGQLLLIEEQR